MRSLLPLLLVLLCVDAHAKLAVAPPIVDKKLKNFRPQVTSAVNTGLQDLDDRLLLEPDQSDRLSRCRNKMSCLAERGMKLGATHILHVVVGRRGKNVVGQFTLVAVRSGQSISTTRIKSGRKPADFIRAIVEGSGKAAASYKAATAPPPAAAAAAPAPAPPPPPAAAPTPAPSSPPPRAAPKAAAAAGEQPPPDTAPPSDALDAGLIGVGQQQPSWSQAPAQPGPGPGGKDPIVQEIGGEANYTAISVAAVGGASVIAGIVFFILQVSDVNSLNETDASMPTTRQNFRDAILDKRTAGLGLISGGAALLGTSGILFATGAGSNRRPATQVSMNAGGIEVTW